MKQVMILVVTAALWLCVCPVQARTKLVALPDRENVVVRLDNPAATLIEEERVLTLQTGVNLVDFSWEGVVIDPDSIDLSLLEQGDSVRLLSVSYPPGEAALTWDIHSDGARQVRVRISYLLSRIDRLVAYRAVADKDEASLDLKTLLVLRNFSGEDFEPATVYLDDPGGLELNLRHEQTLQVLHKDHPAVAVQKIWTFDAATLPWDPEQVAGNVGIPVSYRLVNTAQGGLGQGVLWDGKVRVFQHDGHGSTILLGEDMLPLVPRGEEAEIRIGDSRDIVVTQRKMREQMINVRRNDSDQVVLYDTDEIIEAEVENFKDTPATLTMIQHIDGQWDMEETSMDYERLDATRLEFEIELKAKEKKTLVMHYQRRNVRR